MKFSRRYPEHRSTDWQKTYTVSHNYGNPYEKWNIFFAMPHLWLQLGMVKPEIILCETVLNLSTLNTLTYLLTYLLTNILTSHVNRS